MFTSFLCFLFLIIKKFKTLEPNFLLDLTWHFIYECQNEKQSTAIKTLSFSKLLKSTDENSKIYEFLFWYRKCLQYY